MTREKKSNTLYLVDGTAQLFRAYFAIRNLHNADGMATNAIFGFTKILKKLLRDEQPAYIAVAFDLPGKVFRHDTFPEYKANRPPAPEDLHHQVPYVKQICQLLGIKILEEERFEADDLMATYTRLATESGFEVVIVSSDKDLLQMVGPGVKVLNPSKEILLDTEGVQAYFGVPPEHVLDAQGLMGDTVDNIPGVPGVGQKTAIAMVQTHGGLESVIARAGRFVALYDARDRLLQTIETAEKEAQLEAGTAREMGEAKTSLTERLQVMIEQDADAAMCERYRQLQERLVQTDFGTLTESVGQTGRSAVKAIKPIKKELKALDKGSARKSWYAINDHADQARLSRQLATLVIDAPAKFKVDQLVLAAADREGAAALFESLGFRGLAKEYAAAAVEETVVETAEEITDEPIVASNTQVAGRYETVLCTDQLREMVEACRQVGRFAIDTETDGLDPMRARLVGISMAVVAGHGWYLPLGHHYLGVPDQLALGEVVAILGPLLADPDVGKIGQNFKYDAHILRRHELPVSGWLLDTMVAAFLIDAGRSSFSMDQLAESYLGHTTIKYSDVAGKGKKQVTLDAIPIERVAEYAAEDADITLRLAAVLEPELEASGLIELYRTLDGPVLPLLERMEATGILIDTELLSHMSSEMGSGLERARGEIHRLAGVDFNVDSPKQLREVLFDRLGLQSGRKTTKSKVASTDARTLEALAGDHEIVRCIMDYRELAKLKSTYVDSLPKLVNPETGRVHTSYHPTGAATGRLSSSDPNLQNIPARTEAGLKIRSAFIPEAGYLFLASDYSQVELRVLAHLTGDVDLIAAFKAGEDIHRFTAAKISAVPMDEVTDEMRRRSKAVNFGILYGMSETRLAQEQGISRADAHTFIEAYFERFSSVRGYIQSIREEAIQNAVVKTLFGRRRPFPQLHRRLNRGLQEQALRAAVNTTIQGTAADLMKLAMLRVDEALSEARLDARILLQVHDELLFEVPAAQLEETSRVVKRAMEHVHQLAVPLVVDQKTGANWSDVT
jgi:DNA polymerase-1